MNCDEVQKFSIGTVFINSRTFSSTGPQASFLLMRCFNEMKTATSEP